jgi:hypothetical protein
VSVEAAISPFVDIIDCGSVLSVLGASSSLRSWPDGVDFAAMALYAAIAFGLPLLGYGIMAVDVRRYLRSLRRALVVVARAAYPGGPYWAGQDRPPCLQALELELPCTEEEVLAAYRRRVKSLHPDRGGDLQQFLRLQKHFEQAMHLARSHAKVGAVSVK